MEVAASTVLPRSLSGLHINQLRAPPGLVSTMHASTQDQHSLQQQQQQQQQQQHQAPQHYYSAFPHSTRTSDSTQNTTHSSLYTSSASTAPSPSPGPHNHSHVSATNNVINSVGNKDASMFQICVNLRNRLAGVPGFEDQLGQVEAADDDMDPVTLLWRTFRKGQPLVTLFNYLRPDQAIVVPDEQKEERRSKSATFKFLQACIQKLRFPADDCFIISDLYGEDTGGFAKVIRVVTRVADLMVHEGLLSSSHDDDADGASAAAGMPGAKKTHRQHVVDELVRTERTYVSHLELLQSFKKLVEQRGIITGDAVHDIFLNLNALLDFQRRFLIRVEQTNAQPESEQNWGRLFLSFGDGFEVYEPYIQNQKRCEAVTMQEYPRLKEAGGPPEMRQMVESPTHLTSFLLKPFQRLSKYPLLLKELRNKGGAEGDMKQDLGDAITAVAAVLERANAYLAREERDEAVQELKGQVEDWKGHRVEAFGELMLHGTFTVHKGDPNKDEREYKMYLFEKILLCCKEINPLKQKRIMNKQPAVDKRGRPKLQLKGRIFMQNVTDTTSSVGPTGYTCSIFWKGDEVIEFFVIRFTTEEVMTKWRDQVETQRRLCQESARNALPVNGSETEFTYLRDHQHLDSYGEDGGGGGEEEEEYLVDDSGFPISRNGSSTSLRSRWTSADSARVARQQHGPALALRTQGVGGVTPGATPGGVAPAGGASYFSPGVDSPISSRGSGASGIFPFPRQTTPSGGWQHHDDANRYTAPAMGRSTDPRTARNTTTAAASYAPHPAALSTNRMRSASSPDIHAANLARRANNAPPVPSIPAQIVHGQAVNRSQNNSPLLNGTRSASSSTRLASLQASGQQQQQHHYSHQSGYDAGSRLEYSGGGGLNRSMTVQSHESVQDASNPAQIKVKVRVPSEGSTMTLVVGFNITFQTLKERIDAKMSRYTNLSLANGTVRLKYVDEGEFVSIQNDEDVQTAFETWREQQMSAGGGGFSEIELYCQR